MNRICVYAVLFVLLGCGRGTTPPAGGPEPQVPNREPPFHIVHTEADYWPDPLQRTHVRLASLQVLLERHRPGAGAFPESLEVLLPVAADRDALTRDGWGTPIRYRALTEDFELTSAGPDTIFGTGDDVVANRAYEMPVFAPPPEERTRLIMEVVQLHATLFRERTGTFPERLDDLAALGLEPYLGTTDAWGQPLVYTMEGGDSRIRSAGPDGELNTDDDIVVKGEHPLLVDVAPSPSHP
jgi:hypothetical protein